MPRNPPLPDQNELRAVRDHSNPWGASRGTGADRGGDQWGVAQPCRSPRSRYSQGDEDRLWLGQCHELDVRLGLLLRDPPLQRPARVGLDAPRRRYSWLTPDKSGPSTSTPCLWRPWRLNRAWRRPSDSSA